MLAKFDPIRERRGWLDYSLKIETEFAPERIPSTAQPGYVSLITNRLIDAYWVGLSDEVHPTLKQVVAWMEGQSEPQSAIYSWQRTLGLCKWLSRGDDGQEHFAKAIEVRWQNWRQSDGDRKDRQEALSQRPSSSPCRKRASARPEALRSSEGDASFR